MKIWLIPQYQQLSHLKAKEGNADAVLKILEIYKPLLIKNAIVNGRFDEDLYQELVSTLLQCIQRFQIIE